MRPSHVPPARPAVPRALRPTARLRAPLAAALAAGLLAACATAPPAAPAGPRRVAAPRGAAAPGDRVLARTQLAGLDQARPLHDVLRDLRPGFLWFRGVSPTVYVDGVRVASDATLRELPVRWVERVELLSGAEATLRFGTNHTGAALLVTTRGRH